jgi:hypothetical protein
MSHATPPVPADTLELTVILPVFTLRYSVEPDA